MITMRGMTVNPTDHRRYGVASHLNLLVAVLLILLISPPPSILPDSLVLPSALPVPYASLILMILRLIFLFLFRSVLPVFVCRTYFPFRLIICYILLYILPIFVCLSYSSFRLTSSDEDLGLCMICMFSGRIARPALVPHIAGFTLWIAHSYPSS